MSKTLYQLHKQLPLLERDRYQTTMSNWLIEEEVFKNPPQSVGFFQLKNKHEVNKK